MTHTYDILARTVVQEEPGTCFALLGDANMALAARMSDMGCDFVYVRHEHCAVAAAMAYARKTGDVGLATVTCGPGLTQVMTALPAAVRARLPLVVLAGEAPLKTGWYNQAIDQAPFVTATGAAYLPAHWPARMPVVIRDAFAQARRERRPVVVGLPFDLQELPWDGPEDLAAPSKTLTPLTGPIPPNPDDLARLLPVLASAERPVVMAGMGAVAAAVLGAPISTTLIVFELTGDWQTGLAVMVAVSMSTALSSRIVDKSFFLTQLERRDKHLAAGPQSYLLSLYSAASLMRETDSPRAASRDACEAMIAAGTFILPQTTLEEAMPMFEEWGHRFIPVVAPRSDDNPTGLVGALFYVDALAAFSRALSETAAEEHS